MCALTFVIVGLIVFNVKRRERQILVKQAIEIATDPNLAARVDAFWQSKTNMLGQYELPSLAPTSYSHKPNGQRDSMHDNITWSFLVVHRGSPYEKLLAQQIGYMLDLCCKFGFMTTRKQYFLRQSQDQCFVYATGAAANLSDKNDLGCWATFTHCLFMRKAQLVLDFLMFLSRSSFPQLNKDGASVSPESLEETL
ncbi:hypothetical protein N7455_007821 [Penicillium solitum]|uniref:uncharacterized protein n=1 Tax=Penicillium solitum TaxID=60172 RepID=UPI0018117392|nr:hypothetical protein HAV15_004286 [Penicillium sp. str. \